MVKMVSPRCPIPTNNPGSFRPPAIAASSCAARRRRQPYLPAQVVLNRIDPRLIAITGATDATRTQDLLSPTSPTTCATSVDLTLTDLRNTAEPSVVTYGHVNDTRAHRSGRSRLVAARSWFSTQHAQDPDATDHTWRYANHHRIRTTLSVAQSSSRRQQPLLHAQFRGAATFAT